MISKRWMFKKANSYTGLTTEPHKLGQGPYNNMEANLAISPISENDHRNFQMHPSVKTWQADFADEEVMDAPNSQNGILWKPIQRSISLSVSENTQIVSFETKKVAIKKVLGSPLGMSLKKIGNDFVFAFVEKDLPVSQASIGFGDVLVEIEGCCPIDKCSVAQVLKFLRRLNPGDIYLNIIPRKYEMELTAAIRMSNVVFTNRIGEIAGVRSICTVARTRQIGQYLIIAINDVNLLLAEDNDFMDELTREPGVPKRVRLMATIIARSLLQLCKSQKNKEKTYLSNAEYIKKY